MCAAKGYDPKSAWRQIRWVWESIVVYVCSILHGRPMLCARACECVFILLIRVNTQNHHVVVTQRRPVKLWQKSHHHHSTIQRMSHPALMQ